MDDTGQKRIRLFYIFIFIATSFPGLVVSSVTVEEGRAATLQCPGFTPTPGGDQNAVFIWYKSREADLLPGERLGDYRVAFLAKRDGIVTSERDLVGRATIDSTTGALQITQTRVSDNHCYTCDFSCTSMELIRNETQLKITVTPSEQDLQVTANPPGLVPEGRYVTFNCSATRARPPPKEIYWQFTGETEHLGMYRKKTNSDQLTSSISAQYSLRVSRGYSGRKLVCHYVTSTRTIQSNELTLHVMSSVVSTVTVEEGRAATLQCPGFTPTPGGDQEAIFNWYKAGLGNWSSDNRVAFLAKRDGVVGSERDLKGRATIDSTTGALQITQTRVSDDHIYTCNFVFTSNGQILNNAQLDIKVTPSESDLQVTASPPDPVPEGESVTFNCSASRVRPPPREIYLEVAGEPDYHGNYEIVNNSDKLTSAVFFQFPVKVIRNHNGRKLACNYVTSEKTIKSKELTIQVLFSGTPSSGMIAGITIGTIAGCAVIAIAIITIYQYRRRRTFTG